MLKEELLQKSFIAKAIDEDELKQLVDNSLTNETDAANLDTAAAEYLGQAYMIKGIQYICEEVSAGVFEWTAYNTAGQAIHYPDASGKPTLDGITINGALTKSALGIAPNTAERSAATDPSGMDILLDDDGKITYDNLEDILAANFGISTLPKYEKQSNPLLTSNGTQVNWVITHTCKTSEPSTELYDKNGLKITTELTSLIITHKTNKQITVEWNTASNVAANEYYVVLIG